jgi:acetyltransferase-like isoleucine patch superfamily enzyme
MDIINGIYNDLVLKRNHIKTNSITIAGRIYIQNQGKISIGDNCHINSTKSTNSIGAGSDTRILVKRNAQLIIGEKVGLSNATVFCAESIVIGDNVLIGGGCNIWDTDFHSIDPQVRLNGDYDVKTSPVVIGANAFLGANSIVLKGVTIGECSFIGAGSLISKDIPAYELWAGNPIRFIKKIPNQSNKIINE